MDVEKLEKLHGLKEKGIITQEEFDQKKKELLESSEKQTEPENVENASDVVLESNKSDDGEKINKFPMLEVVKLLRYYIYALVLALFVGTTTEVKDWGILFVLVFACGTGAAIGNVIRKFTMPDAILTTGLMDTLGKKIFWAIGPQTIGFIAAPFILSSIMEEKNKAVKNNATHYVARDVVNYRDAAGEIKGKLKKGTGIVCTEIVDNRCKMTIDGKEFYIQTSVLTEKK